MNIKIKIVPRYDHNKAPPSSKSEHRKSRDIFFERTIFFIGLHSAFIYSKSMPLSKAQAIRPIQNALCSQKGDFRYSRSAVKGRIETL